MATKKGINEIVELLRQTVRDQYHTGSIAPSSRQLSRAVAHALPANHPPRNILEAGPGTGPVTRELAERLLPGDKLTLCEINPYFVNVLERWRATLPPAKREQITIFSGDILKLQSEPFHHIFCALPFTNFPSKLVEDIFLHFHRLSLPQTQLTFFEYFGGRKLRRVVAVRGRRELAEVDRLLAAYTSQAQTAQKVVWFNFPPAKVRHLSVAALEEALNNATYPPAASIESAGSGLSPN